MTRRSTHPSRGFLALLFLLAGAGAAGAQDGAPAAADDPIQYPVTDASGTIVSHAVVTRKELDDRTTGVVAQMEMLQNGFKRFLIQDDGFPLLLEKTAVDQAVAEMKRILNDPGAPPDAKARIQRRLQAQEDPARHAAARSALQEQYVNLRVGAVVWSKVRGTLRGTFRMSCTIDGRTEPVDGNFQIVLMGDGSTAAAFSDPRILLLRADGRIDPFGEASGTASSGDATIRWSAKFERAADGQLLMTRHTLEVTPKSGRCQSGSMALGEDAAQPVTTTWFPDPMDWRAVRGRIGLDGHMDCWNASGSLPRIYSRWGFTLVGDGNVRGTVQTVKGDFNVPQLSAPTAFVGKVEEYRMTSGSPVEGGFIRATTRLPEGEYTFTVPLRRSQVDRNKLEVHSGWSGTGLNLVLDPGEGMHCQGGPMGQWE